MVMKIEMKNYQLYAVIFQYKIAERNTIGTYIYSIKVAQGVKCLMECIHKT